MCIHWTANLAQTKLAYMMDIDYELFLKIRGESVTGNTKCWLRLQAINHA
jgi:hypothetical protein